MFNSFCDLDLISKASSSLGDLDIFGGHWGALSVESLSQKPVQTSSWKKLFIIMCPSFFFLSFFFFFFINKYLASSEGATVSEYLICYSLMHLIFNIETCFFTALMFSWKISVNLYI